MIPKYRTQLQLNSGAAPAKLEEVRDVVCGWLARKERFDADALQEDEGVREFASGSRAEVLHEIVGDTEQWVMQYVRKDDVEPVRWVVDVGVSASETATVVSVSMGLDVDEQRALNLKRRLHPPLIVGQLAERFEAVAGKLVSTRPLRADTKGVGELYQWICSGDRVLPLVVLSVDPFTERPLLKADELQRLVLGLGEVWVLTKRAAFELPELFRSGLGGSEDAELWAVYNGAVRIYWPSLDLARDDSSPYKHKLWVPKDEALGPMTRTRILETLSWAAVHRRYEDWTDLGRARRRLDRESLEKLGQGLSTEERRRYDLALSRHEKQIDVLTHQLEEAVERGRVADENLESVLADQSTIRKENSRLRRRLGELTSRLDGENFESVDSAVEEARRRYSSTLLFASDLSSESSESGDYWIKVFAVMDECCARERKGEIRGHNDLKTAVATLLGSRGLPSRPPKHKDSGVRRKHPEGGEVVHLKWRIHLRSGSPGETEAIYWQPTGEGDGRRYLIGSIGRHQ